MEKYTGSIDVEFDGMPSIQLESYTPKHNARWFERFALATRRRRFSLREKWAIKLNNISYKSDLNGTVIIPVEDHNSETIVFDGASIPVPWLISFLTIGILRPLGVAFIGSVVHDYAYQYGKLNVAKQDGSTVEVMLERHEADKLFRDIIKTINGLPIVGYIAWLAVRIGWLWVPYNKKRFTGKPPIVEYCFFILLICGFTFLLNLYGFKIMLTWLIIIYFGIYVSSLALGCHYSKKKRTHCFGQTSDRLLDQG